MKAISIKQPYAGLIASGEKTIETRTWQTQYRGDLLICSSQKADKGMGHEWYRHTLCWPLACTICLVDVVDCVPMTKEHEMAAMCMQYDNAWAWMLENIRPVKQIPMTGKLSIYELPHLTHENLLL